MLKLEISVDAQERGVMVEIQTPHGTSQSVSEVMAYLIICDALNVLLRLEFGAPPEFDCTARSLRPYKKMLVEGESPPS